MLEEPDNFTTSIPDDQLPLLLDLGHRYGFDPLSSIEMEAYFTTLLATTPVEVIEQRVVPSAFLTIGPRPVWLQSREWPISDSKPMVFVGQVNVPTGNGFIPGETSVYVFAERGTGVIHAIVQKVSEIT